MSGTPKGWAPALRRGRRTTENSQDSAQLQGHELTNRYVSLIPASFITPFRGLDIDVDVELQIVRESVASGVRGV